MPELLYNMKCVIKLLNELYSCSSLLLSQIPWQALPQQHFSPAEFYQSETVFWYTPTVESRTMREQVDLILLNKKITKF